MEKDRFIRESTKSSKKISGIEKQKGFLEKLPLGGWTSYAEIIRDIRLVYNEMHQDQPNHDEEIRESIAERIQSPVGFVDLCLSNSEFLTVQCLSKLVDKREEVDFFVEAQKVKRQIQKPLIQKGLSPKNIETKISKAVLAMRTEYRQTGKIDKKNYKEIDNDDWDINKLIKPSTKLKKPLKYWTPPKDTSEQRPFQRSEFKQEFEAMLREMSCFGNALDIEPAIFEQKVRELFHSIARFLCQLSQKVPQEGGQTP